jgi:hypothetical protein
MPLSKDEQGGGTNTDGSKSVEYCSHCYQNGKFTQPDLTVTQMQDRVKGKLLEMHFPRIVAQLFTKNIPSLKRWHQTQ